MAFEQRKKEINGTEYTFQFPGVRAANEMADRSKNENGVVMQTKLQEEYWKHIVVDPKVSFDYFDEKSDDYAKVLEVAGEVFNGPFAGK